jgi:hypothetical protein
MRVRNAMQSPFKYGNGHSSMLDVVVYLPKGAGIQLINVCNINSLLKITEVSIGEICSALFIL